MIYLDSHSTTKPDTEVISSMFEYYTKYYGNASSLHDMGLSALGAVEKSRQSVSTLLGVESSDVYFTNSATESNNIIVKGMSQSAYLKSKKQYNIITTLAEHKSILNPILTVKKIFPKININYVMLNSDGTINLEDFKNKLNLKNILFVSIMAANNEIGTVHDIKKLSKMCYDKGIFFHTDATQAIGKVDIDWGMESISAISLSAHKIYGPKGCGVLYIKSTDSVDPVIDGGMQNTISSGTINVPAIVGMGKACELLNLPQNKEDLKRIRDLRDTLLGGILGQLDDVAINGTMENRLVNNLNLSIKDVPSEVFLNLPDICVSSGSACEAGYYEPSHVLNAIGAQNANNAVRFGISKYNTKDEIIQAIGIIVDLAKEVRYVG